MIVLTVIALWIVLFASETTPGMSLLRLEPLKAKGSFSVASWNVLAECYSAKAPSFAERKGLIFDTLLKTGSDIYCLQEVDYGEDIREALSTRYSSVYAQRPGRADGLLIAYDSSRFEQLGDEYVVNFDDLVEVYESHNEKLFTRANIGLCLLLRERHTEKTFLCSNTHLYWNPMKSEVKLAQTRFFLEELVKRFGTEDDVLPPLVLGGDFNSMPTSDLYKRITKAHLFTGSIFSRLDDGADKESAIQREMAQSSTLLCGPGTKFLADHSLKKICSWLRLLGIDCAMEDDKCHQERTKKPLANFEPLFTRAQQEQRVILTSSRKVQERSACPQSYFVATANFEASLVSLVQEFNLTVNEKTFLTVCGKCGGKIEKIERDDARLKEVAYLPTERPLFCCSSCSQPYWWSERADSSPARAMRVASRLYKLIQRQHAGNNVEAKSANLSSSVYATGITEEEVGQRNAFLSGSALDDDLADLTEMFEKRDASLLKVHTEEGEEETEKEEGLDVGGDDVRKRATRLSAGLRSAYASSHGGVTEPALTNWNGEFKGCLDYIFISSHFTAVEGSGKVVPRISTTAVETTGSLEDEEDPLEVPYGGVVTSHWPSDHFLVKTEIMFSHNE